MAKFAYRAGALTSMLLLGLIIYFYMSNSLNKIDKREARVSLVNVDVEKNPHVRQGTNRNISPLGAIPDPGLRDTAQAMVGHLNLMRKDLDYSRSNTSGREQSPSNSELQTDLSDSKLKDALLSDSLFKNNRTLEYVLRIAKALGYEPGRESERSARNPKSDTSVKNNMEDVRRPDSEHKVRAWYNARTYGPPIEPDLTEQEVGTLSKVVQKKKLTHSKKRQIGKRIKLYSEEDGKAFRSYQKFHNHISQFKLYSPYDPAIAEVLSDLANLKIVGLRTMSSYGTEIKLLFKLADGSMTLFKPVRFARDLETLPDHYYFDDFERPQAEIAAFHLDRVLGFYRVPPNAGRAINLTHDVQRFSDSKLNKTFYISPAGNVCFYGKCDYYCDSGHSVCGNPYMVEGSCAVMLPGVISAVDGKKIAVRESYENPYARSYSKRRRADWEDDPTFCDTVVKLQEPYNYGRRLLDLVDIHIFDFLTGNLDRHHYHIFQNFGNYSSPFLFDNGRGFGKSNIDEIDILAPLYQCCVIRFSTLEKLLSLHKGPEKLSDAMRRSLEKDKLHPVLNEPMLRALDRRVKSVLLKVSMCISRNNDDYEKVVVDDGF